MARRSALCSIMEVVAQLLVAFLLSATLEEKVEVAAITLGEITLKLHRSESEVKKSNFSKNSRPINDVQYTTNESENISIKENGVGNAKLLRTKRSDTLSVTVYEENARTSDKSSLEWGIAAPQASGDLISNHQTRHNHTRVPGWLKEHIEQLDGHKEIKVKRSHLEDDIAAVFHDVAYGKNRNNNFRKIFSNTGNRYERTTVLSETPDYNYIADESVPAISGRRKVKLEWNVSNSSTSEESFTTGININDTRDSPLARPKSLDSNILQNIPSWNSSALDSNSNSSEIFDQLVGVDKYEESVLESVLEHEIHDNEMYSLYENDYSDFYSDEISKISRRGDSLLANNASKSVNGNMNNRTRGVIDRLPISRLSWFDYLLCTNRNMAWILINFLLGVLLLGVSIFAPYRLLTLRSCTHILPRTHFVSVHLLVFIAMSLKALYMFHLAFGGKERLPLVLILILTNTSIPCFISAYLVLVFMMFLTTDVQVYKPKFLTMHNISIFIVMMMVLSFVADIIVGAAHSKSVLVMSRVMLIAIAIVMIAFYIRKYPKVIQVVHMLKREFQGELKLLVVPTKDSPQQKQMNIKYILRNRLHHWCRIMNMTTIAIGICCLLHFVYAIFLISSHVPVWVWWSVHASGAFIEAAVGVLICIAAALTQCYDEKKSFISDFFIPSLLSNNKKRIAHKERNGNVVYQRVSYSSGTESTQYTNCPNEVAPTPGSVSSRTPKPPRRRTATVRRSATFSYAPQYPRAQGRPCQPPVPNLNVMRAGSASQIPLYSPGSVSQVSDIYSPASISHVPVYSSETARSMLVHDGGFVRIRTQVDPRETHHRRSGSHSGLHEVHSIQHDSNPQIYNANLQYWNAYGSRESFYHCLPRRRRSSRNSSFHQHNSQIAETDYFHGAPPRIPIDHINFLEPIEPRTVDPNYQSLTRRRPQSRDSSFKQLNNTEQEDEPNLNQNRRPSSRCLNMQQMNNLDRSEEDYQSLGRRKLSRDDNNEPIYHNSSHDGSYHKLPECKSNIQYSKASPMNVSDRNTVSPTTHQSGSPAIKIKISNIPASPVKVVLSPSPVHNPPVGYSPLTSRREAHYPKPFSHRGSNSSLRSEDIPYLEHYQRTNPVRRNHSSAGYFPSRYLQPVDASLTDDTRRYGSLRLGVVKKRQPGYVLHTNTSKLLNKYLDKYPKSTSMEDSGGSEYGVPNKVQHKKELADAHSFDTGGTSLEKTVAEGKSVDDERPQSAANTSKGSDADWALELITSSSILTDFYSLKRPKKKKEDIEEEEEEEE